MAVRFYVPSYTAPISPTFDASWEKTTDAQRLAMYPYRLESPDFDTNPNSSETSTSGTFDVLLAQLISEPLPAQTLTGTVQGVFHVFESSASANFRSQIVIRVVSGDGSTFRGTAYGPDTSAFSNEWPNPSSGPRFFPKGASSPASLSSVSVQDGDRLVVELGYRATNTSSTSFSGVLLLSGKDSNPFDQLASETESGGNDWIEFSNLTLDSHDSFSDSIAAAPDVTPADGGGNMVYNVLDWDTFTTETDDPTVMDTDESTQGLGYTGWVKVSSGANSISIRVRALGTSLTEPCIYVFQDVPTASMAFTARSGSSETGFFSDHTAAVFSMSPGETYYIGMTSYEGQFWDTTENQSVQMLVERDDTTGEIKDFITDAIDVFPASMASETFSDTGTFWAFSQETDDPTEILDWEQGDPFTPTGWLKLVVPTDASVTIESAVGNTTDYIAGWLYDEVPTASSVAIYSDDGSSPTVNGFYLPELALTAGTYYLGLAYWDHRYANGVIVKVRWEQAPTINAFDVDAVVKRTMAYPFTTHTSTIRDVSTASVDSDTILTLPVPAGAQPGDVLMAIFALGDESGDWNTAGQFSPNFDNGAGWNNAGVPSGFPSLTSLVTASGEAHQITYPGSPTTGRTIMQVDFQTPNPIADDYWFVEIDGYGTFAFVDNAYNQTLGDFAIYSGLGDMLIPGGLDPGTWYTLKADTDRMLQLAKAKVWKRSDPEPSSWMIDAPGYPPTYTWPMALYVQISGAGTITVENPLWSVVDHGGDDTWFTFDEANPFASPPRRKLVIMGYDAPNDDPNGSNRWFGWPPEITFTSTISTSIVGTMIAFDGSVTGLMWDSNDTTLADGGQTQWSTDYLYGSYLPNDPLFVTHWGELTKFIGIFVGDGTGTWTEQNLGYGGISTPVTAVSAASVDVAVFEKVEEYTYTWFMLAEYSHLVGPIGAIVSVVDVPIGRFTLGATIQSGGLIFFNSYIQAATHTTHPRTGPHFGVTGSDFITLSSALGSLSTGDTVTEALTELEDKIRRLEHGDLN